MFPARILSVLVAAALATAAAVTSRCDVEVETRTLDEMHQAALQEGGIVTVWHGGDEKNTRDQFKAAFESRFPGVTMNLTVDLSKYIDGNVDLQRANNDVYVDSVILQTVHDYPRWKAEGALLQYKPLGWDKVYNQFKDQDGYWNGVFAIAWSAIVNTNYVQTPVNDLRDFLKPEFGDGKLILTYPNDDDAVLFAFWLIIKEVGWGYLDALIAQKPRWVRGSLTTTDVLAVSNGTNIATFTGNIGMSNVGPLNTSFPQTGPEFMTWIQRGAILKEAPHPETAKLLHSWILSPEFQSTVGWGVRSDVAPPAPLPPILEMPNTNITAFDDFMADRAAVERFRFILEDKLGTAQGLSPLDDDL